MLSFKLAEKRHSIRSYKTKALSGSDLSVLKQLIEEAPVFSNDSGLKMVLVQNGFELAPKLSGYAGYFGNMIEAPQYIVLTCTQGKLCRKTAGYIGEWLVLNALKHELGACWIEVLDSVNVKRILELNTDDEAVAMIAFGYPKKEHQMSSIYANMGQNSLSSLTDMGYPNITADFSQAPTRDRKTIMAFVYLNEWGVTPELENLEKLGLHEALFYMRLAPSYGNRQPWMFLIRNSGIDLIVETSDKISGTIQCLDAGIAMFYLEVGLKDSGFRGSWNLDEGLRDDSIPEGYAFAGRYVFE